MTPDPPQQLTEEYAYRNELQMQLDSKESDIEQLREKLNDLQLRVDSSSVTSLQTDETDGNLAGKVPPPPPHRRHRRRCQSHARDERWNERAAWRKPVRSFNVARSPT